MRLAIEVTTCDSSRTGVGYYTEHLVDALLETRGRDDEVALLSNRWPAPELAKRWSPHLRVHGVNVRAVWMQSTVPRLLTDARADVGVFPNYVVPLASPCPTVVVVHDLAILRMPQHFKVPKRLLMRPMLRQSVAAASVIATVSEASRNDIVALLGVDRERVALLPAAAHPSCHPAPPDVVTEVRSRHGLHRPYILTVGTLEPRKNLLSLMRSFDRLGEDAEGHDLVVVGGRGWLDRPLLRELEARSKSRRVRWLGYVPESDLVALYTGADLFVLASKLEGFGLPVLEAMACGTRVIASDVAALREVGGDVATFVAPGDEAALERAIRHALRDREGTAAARRLGPSHASQFSWTRTAEALWARVRRIAPARVSAGAGTGNGAAAAAEQEGASPKNALLPPPVHPCAPGISAREWALLATVVYADLFDSPLPLDVALIALIGVVLDDAEIRRLARAPALSSLLTLHPKGFLTLAGREHLVDAIPEREELTRALLERNGATLSMLAALPFIRALVISGGLAHRNPGARPDVDLFVVVARGRAYTAYTLIVLATRLTGTRRQICPNYLVDESELPIVYHQDLFTAHQLRSSRPFSGQRAYEALCRGNETWVRSFFPAFAARSAPAGADRPARLQDLGELAFWPAAGTVEALLRWAWRFHLRRRAATAPHADVVLSDGIVKLHLSDYRRRVLDRFGARLHALRVQLDSGSRPRQPGLDPVGT
jgi:glycosyltransferase involved in cell wall biosynthesis